LALNVWAAANEKIAQFRRVVIAVVERIEPEENLAARGEVLLQITQEKIPLRCPPAFLRWVIKVEVGREGGDPIELLTKIGQWFERADPPNDARNTEKLEQFGKKSDVLDIQAHYRMAEVFRDEQEKSATAPEIENAFRLCTMEFQLLHASGSQSQPRLVVRVFGVSSRGIRIALLDFSGARFIDFCQHWLKRNAKNRALRSAQTTPVGQRLGKFQNLSRKIQLKIDELYGKRSDLQPLQ